MNNKSQIMNVEEQAQKEQPWLKMDDEEIYVLNPLCRLLNSKSEYVQVWSVQGLPRDRIHRAAGIVLALCNGKRTVADIARITRPLVKIADDAKASEIAKAKVKEIIYTMSQTMEERNGEPPIRSELPATTILLTKADYDRKFKRTKFVQLEYHISDFLPKNQSEMSPVPALNRREPVPLLLVWHFTSDCSTDCRYCYMGRRKIKPMPKERTLSLIEEAAAMGTQLSLTGGELLLYPYLEDVLKAMCKHKFLPVEFSTKCFLSKDKAKFIAEAASVVMALQFSIDSTVNDVADYLVGAKNFCDRIFRSIDNALEVGIRVNTKAVITPYNILTIPKLYRDLKKRGVNRIRLASYSRSGFHHSDDLFNHAASYKWLVEQLRQLQKEFPDDDIVFPGSPTLELPSLENRRKNWPERGSCTAGGTSMMICADGKVIPCEQMPETDEYFCGDVSYQSIQEVWDSDRLRELTYGMPREKFKGQICYDCDEWERCVYHIGNCIRDLAVHHGGIYQPSPYCPKYNGNCVRML